MDASALKRDLVDEFGDDLENDQDTLELCADLCSTYHIDAQSLRFKWEALSHANHRKLVPISSNGAADLKTKLANGVVAASKRADAASARTRRPQAAVARTPVAGPSAQAADVKPFFTATPSSSAAPLVSDRRYRYMHEKILDRSEALDDRIDRFAELISEHYSIPEFADPAAVTEEDVVVVGRICCDADAKLNEASMVLEASRVVASGVRVPIRFAPNATLRGGLAPGQPGIGFFPGAMAVFKGRNGGGGWFVVSEVLPIPLLKRNAPPGPTVNVSIYVAAGPYTYENDFEFAPLKRLLEHVQEKKPTALLLLGPFVDCNHAKIRDGDVDEHPLAIFRRAVLVPLGRCTRTTVYVVPSVRDAVSDHAVFPQGELRDEWGGLPPNVRMLPNPCVLSIGGLRVGASSVDVLKQLSGEQFVKPLAQGGVAGDAYVNLCRQVLNQRSFYPLFPAPSTGGVNLDVTHSEFLDIEAPAPDVLVLPSAFNAFHRDVDGCAVVNPSFCSKPGALGSYGMVTCEEGKMSVSTSKL